MNPVTIEENFKFHDIPKFSVSEFNPRSTKYCFLPIVYNEGERFRAQLLRMSQRAGLADIIIAARESNDGSLESEYLKHQNPIADKSQRVCDCNPHGILVCFATRL